ncbi:outer membrane beta-barrel protein [Prosthecobacter sp.]|uniref:outer membrane beta-barrel protein n=1 Tax=Prosthecobacter sp. TaxID=1965333 RepID=UPI002489BB07|nr:outer membrane beta-barrel protein [Prosthecobacter sp.]MDI1312539.1 outer membrane beta-barrel protein [Prosthecobacter sp.]
MRSKLVMLILAVAALSPAALRAQGLVGIQNYSADFRNEEPLTFSLTGSSGYDVLKYKVPTAQLSNIESWYGQVGAAASYTHADQTTPYSFSLEASVLEYVNGVPTYGSTFYNGRATFNFEHQFSERLKMSNNFYLTYGTNPNSAFGYGATSALWNGQFLYGYNNFNVSYAWSPRFSTTTSYTFDGIAYENSAVATSQDRYSHLIAQQFAYKVGKRTSLTAEYRYRLTDYTKSGFQNYRSHFALVGVDHAWSENMSTSVRGGAELYENAQGRQTKPYAEGALNYAVAEQTQIRWFAMLGFNGALIGNYRSSYGVNTGVQVNHQVSKRFSVNGGVSYAHSVLSGGPIPDQTQDSVFLNAGIGYQLMDNLNLNANYSFSTQLSNDPVVEFNRNQVSVGATATF